MKLNELASEFESDVTVTSRFNLAEITSKHLVARVQARGDDINEFFSSFLEDENELLRSAAIDALGIVREPNFPLPAGADNFDQIILFNSQPPICLNSLQMFLCDKPTQGWPANTARLHWEDDSVRELDSDIHEQICQMLTRDPDEKVRSAAARFLKNENPNDNRLRIAEWGVWINDGNGLMLAQSVIDEIPSFVH